jgi:hypothetical protein
LPEAIGNGVARTRAAMAQASEVVLAGFRLRSDAKIVHWPDRYMVRRIDNSDPLLYNL